MNKNESEKYLSERTERIRSLLTAKYCTISALRGIRSDEVLHFEAMHIDRLVYALVVNVLKYADVLQEIAHRIDHEKREIFRMSISYIDDFRYNERI